MTNDNSLIRKLDFRDLLELDPMVASEAATILSGLLSGQVAGVAWNELHENDRTAATLLSDLVERAAQAAILLRIHLANYVPPDGLAAGNGSSPESPKPVKESQESQESHEQQPDQQFGQ